LTIDGCTGAYRKKQITGPKTRKILGSNGPVSATRPLSQFGTRGARPQNACGRPREIIRDFPIETAIVLFELPCPLAEKQLPRAQRLRKLPPRVAKNNEILRENRPLVWKEWPKNSENTFLRTTRLI